MSIIVVIALWYLSAASIIPQSLAVWGTIIGALKICCEFFFGCIGFGMRLQKALKE